MSNAKLTIRAVGKPDQEFIITGLISIGRAFDNSICIDNANTSRYHAVIEPRTDGYWLSDLSSRNGTSVNGAAVTSDYKLEHGDSISIGNASTLEFHLDESLVGARAVSSKASPSQAMADETLPVQQSPMTDAAPKPSASPSSPALMTGMAIIVAVGLVTGAALLLMFFRSGAGKATDRNESGQNRINENQRQQAGSDSNTNSDDSAVANPIDNGPPSTADEASVTSPGLATPGVVEITAMAKNLASAIGSRTDFIIEPEFADRILRRTTDYRINMIDDARQHSREIRRAFGTDKGLHPLIGFVLAMSRSKFKPNQAGEGVGLWQIPRRLLQESAMDDNGSSANDPERATQVAASYTKSLMSQFRPEEFMYAIAYFGKPMGEIGELLVRLAQQAPNDRGNFWKMVKLRVVPPEAAEQVVRFFAAGIVGENPRKFGLDIEPLGSLYY